MPTESPTLAHSIAEAATIIGIGRTSMYALIDDGEITTIRIGRRRVVPYAALEAYVARKMAQQAEPATPRTPGVR